MFSKKTLHYLIPMMSFSKSRDIPGGGGSNGDGVGVRQGMED